MILIIVELLFLTITDLHSLRIEDKELSFDELPEYINQHPSLGWKAVKYDRFKTIEDVHKSLGVLMKDIKKENKRIPTVSHKNLKMDLPPTFDARDKWKNCPSISTVYDESKCASTYAMVATGTMSDRICIFSKETKSVYLSTIDVISCCSDCGRGCNGGFYYKPWDFWMSEGIVTGGPNNSVSSCLPYPFPKCNHLHTTGKYPECGTGVEKAPECSKQCQSPYGVEYSKDINVGKAYYYINGTEEDIRKELYENGTVQSAIDVYIDFINYQSGIYKHISQYRLGYYPVRIIGWGEDKVSKTPYWLCAHVWNEGWGENGYFRILRGKNECSIESYAIAGMPSE